MAKLNTYVNVDGTWYGPDSEIPGALTARITNPKVWADVPEPVSAQEPANADLEVKEPPRGGPGSSADAWRKFMESNQFEVPDGATAKDMQAAWDARNEG